jgi:carboxypeptidase Taq
MSFARLDAHLKKLESLEHALSILRVDEATQMPAGGGEKRAEAVAALAAMHHEQATAREVGDWIAAAETEELSDDQRAAVRELRRVYTNMTCLPADFVRRQTEATMRCEQMWRELRPRGDWAGFQPALEGVVKLVREEAALRADVLKLDPYDALMEQFDPGGRAADVAPVFATLKAFLVDFVPQALARQEEMRGKMPLKPLNAPFAIEKQRELGLAMMAALGFDLTHGRLDVSHHPFCGGVPSDVRITTRYSTADFLSALMGTLHETGHALYEQGLPPEWRHWPLGKARGMAIHESQSLFVEKQIARSREFWEWAMPQLRTHLGDASVDGFALDDVLAHVHRIERGLIRVEADEATYPLHVILRFELEQELVAGRMQVADIPEAWHFKMMEYLGLPTIDSPQDGAMQDVHWAAGAFGYFPSYTLGALIAAQQWSALEKDIPDARENMRRGAFDAINNWRREKIWREASRWPTPELLERATGEPLNAEHFMRHLKQRYLN